MADFVIERQSQQLQSAVINGRCDYVEVCLKTVCATVVESREPETLNTPLHWACTVGCVQCVRSLVEASADVHSQNAMGKTPLHIAVEEGFVEIAQFLAGDVFASHSIKDIDGATPLHYAAACDSDYFLRLFLSYGGNAEVVDHEGDTPLHWVVREGRRQNLRVLLEACPAAVNIANVDGETPLDLAKELDEDEMCADMQALASDVITVNLPPKQCAAGSGSGIADTVSAFLNPFSSEKFRDLFGMRAENGARRTLIIE